MICLDGSIHLKAATPGDDWVIECDAYTGAIVERWNWELGRYRLQLSIDGCDLSRVDAGAVPLLDNHDSEEGCESVIGKVESASKREGKLKCTARFSKSDPKAQSIWAKVQEKIISRTSVGAAIGLLADISGENDKIKTFLATEWKLVELSVVGIPADMNAGFSQEFPDKLNLKQLAGDSKESQPEQVSEAGSNKAQKEEPMAEQAINPQPAVTSPPPAAGAAQVLSIEDAKKLSDDAAKLAAQKERQRVIDINTLASTHKIESLATKAIAEGWDIAKFNTEALAAIAKREEDLGTQRTHHEGARVQHDQREKLSIGLEMALTLKANPQAPPEVKAAGRDYASRKMVDMARMCVEVCGISTLGWSDDLLISVATNPRHEKFGGMQSTSDFPNILANVGNKTLRAAYEAAPRTFQPFCRMVTAADFKPVNRIQMSDVSALLPVNEHGEFKRITVSDSKETYSLSTWGGIIAITRKVIINDDMSALSRIPAGLGVAAANLESDTVWGIITTNGNMADSVALFHATHKNLSTSNGLAAVANITTARKLMRKQTAPKGTILNLVPKYMLVPAALEGIAFQLVNPINLAATAATADVPAFVRSMIPIVEPRLDAVASVGDTNWYTAADPSMIDTIEYCYLQGAEGLYTETRNGFDVDGVEIKARQDFAAAAIDYRGLQKNTA